ncbi:MAG: efflux RND transporter periplasmic adaptor subunit [Myxococcota bacterium]|jgi:RND family efflux transporter MFP subunit|nr:efflux RND transporter periplasmic adaptor subunit [Myxococcota bacterium]
MSSPSINIAITCIACLLLGGCKQRSETKLNPTSVPVEVWRAEAQTMPEVRRISGDVMPWEIIPLSFKVGGRLTKVLIEEGKQIKKGQTVAVLDSKDYSLMHDLATAQVKAIEPHVGRAEKLMASEAVSASQMDQLRSQLEAARIQESQAQAQLSYARLVSPIDGVILKRMASPGDMTDPSHPVGIVAMLHRAKVILTVPQQDLSLFAVGREIDILEPGNGRTLTGAVHSIGYAADEKTRTFPVVVEIKNDDLYLRAGMIVEAVVHVGDLTGIFVPLDAVTRDTGGRPSVLLVDPKTGTAVSRPIEMGTMMGARVHVRSGIALGDAVIVRGQPAPGDAVTVRSGQGETAQAKTP